MHEIVIRYLGSDAMAGPIRSWLCVAVEMAGGAAEYGRPAIRRAALERTADNAKRLYESFSALVVEDRLRAFGPLTVTGIPSPAEPPPSSGEDISISSPQIGLTPIRAKEYADFDIKLRAIERELRAAAQAEPAASAGGPKTKDAILFFIEQLVSIWTSAKGTPPAVVGRKEGGFGIFVEDILAAAGQPFDPAEVRTALRYVFEMMRPPET